MLQRKILIVDDRPENIYTLEHILESEDRIILTANTGEEALLINTIEEIDLILLDYQLDDMNGVDVARQLRVNEKTKHIPIIFVTALSKNERKKIVEFEIGTIDFIFKPIDLLEVQTKVAIFERIVDLQKKLKEKSKMMNR